jgi:DnaJ-class molecular chaperone
MTREQALAALDITDAADANAAFRRLSTMCHPDSATPDPALWAAITEARAVLLAPPPRCATCKGTGRVKMTRWLSAFCTDCGGTGVAST